MTAKPDQESSKERILPLPPLPVEIKDAVNRSELVVFIGAGVSRIIGCKSWSELADQLIEACFNEGCINFKEKQRLLTETNPKKKISICQHILDGKGANLFLENVKKSIELDKTKSANFPIYEKLHKLRAIYVTTNVDTYFDDLYFKDLIKYLPEDFNAENIRREILYHLHGTIQDERSLILTVRSYRNLYTNEKVQKFLSKLFDEYSVLFVGYGMEEFEILDFLFEKASTKMKERKHFILLPMFRGEENILAFEESYYGDLGITVIPYAIDENGHKQLYYVIENFEKEINLSSTFLHSSFQAIEKNIDRYDPESARYILQLIKNDRPLEDHFFRKLNSIEWLLPLKEAGYFDPSKNPKRQPAGKEGFYTVPYWNVLDYLMKVSLQVGDENSKKYADELMNIVRSIIAYREEDKQIENNRTNWALVKIISNVPLSSVIEEDIEAVRQFLHSGWSAILVSSVIEEQLFPKLLKYNDKAKVLQLADIVFSVSWQKGIFGEEPKPIMQEYALIELIKKNKTQMSLLYPLDLAKVVISKIDEITSRHKIEFSSSRVFLVTDPPDFLGKSFENVICRLAKDLLSSAMAKEIIMTKNVLEELLVKEHPIFRRLALSVIDLNWETTSDLFLGWVKKQALIDYELRHEIRAILERHYSSFTSEMKDTFLRWIEEGPNWERKGQNKEAFKQGIAYWKQNWLFALMPSGYDKVAEAYNKYKEITQTEPEQIKPIGPAVIEFHARSPVSVEELVQKTNEHIAQFLKDFKENKDSWSAPTIDGLANTLCEAVKSDPFKFESKLQFFTDVPLVYQSSIIQGFIDSWKDKKEIKSAEVLAFCKKLISDENFWDETDDKKESRRNWLVSQIADFIVAGTKNDANAFPSCDFPIIEDTVLTLMEKTQTNIQYEGDLLTSTLNSAKGRVICALVEYALHVARLKPKEQEGNIYWSEPIKTEFNKRLDRTIEPSLEWSLSLGEYLPNLYFLDKDWVKNNIDKIFLKDNKAHWMATLEGYLTLSQVYPPLYDLLKTHGHLKDAVLSDMKKDMRERLIDHLCIGFLRGKENLTDEDSLFRLCIDSWKHEDILNVLSFFWMQRNYLLEETSDANLKRGKMEYRQKILTFCNYVYAKLSVKKTYSESEKQILSRLSLLSCFVEKVDEESLLWMELAARFTDEVNSIFFVEYMDKLCDASPHEVGVIFLGFASQLITYTKEDIIRSIISKLFKKERELAIKICNTYFERGLEFIRDIYEANK